MSKFLTDNWYIESTNQRIEFIDRTWGFKFFEGKTVLDLGGGAGHVSAKLAERGAKCTVYEGRLEHIQAGREAFPDINFIEVNFEENLPLQKFDVVLNFGIFYHLRYPHKFLKETVKLANLFMLLDGNISINETRIFNEPISWDTTMIGEVKLLTENELCACFEDYTLQNCDQEMDKVKTSTGSPYVYAGTGDAISDSYVKRTFWIIQK